MPFNCEGMHNSHVHFYAPAAGTATIKGISGGQGGYPPKLKGTPDHSTLNQTLYLPGPTGRP